jgi:hypothetical protein
MEASMSGSAGKTIRTAIADWLRDRGTSRDQLAELERLEGPELERMAQETGLTSVELRALAAHGPHAADLLPLRMAAAGLDPVAFEETDPATFRDLQRLCATCRSKGECAHDLAWPLTAEALPDYCPNRDTLRALGAESA